MRRIAVNTHRDTVAVMLVIGIAALLAIATSALSAGQRNAAQSRALTPPPSPIQPAASEGGLILRPAQGEVATSVPAMRLGTDITADVTGQTARVTVTQAFRNTSDDWMEATYLYPLPDNGAVDTLSMVVGDRIFRGNIKPREEAREIYEEALENGQKAGLVEQSRPNMFRNSIANVGPGETVVIQIEFQAPVRQVAGEYALRMPLVVGPRYVSDTGIIDTSPVARMTDNAASRSIAMARANAGAGAYSGRAGLIRASQLAGQAELTAPVASPRMVREAGAGLNPVSITVNLDPGFEAEAITSPYHQVSILDEGDETHRITLANGAVPADRDFELRWSAAGEAPSLGLFRQGHGELDYVMATITPPSAGPSGQVPPREMIFVIDNSGSMAGGSMDAARRSLLYALETLRPEDRFNIIRFDDTMEMLFPASALAKGRDLQRAISFTHGLDAQGGTEMLPALRAALLGSAADAAIEAAECAEQTLERRPSDMQGQCSLPVRQVIFLTDGSLSNEAAMMEEINRRRDRSRVFMVGIGSAPNSYLMRRMAEAGRGTFTHIGNGNEAESQMQRLLDRLAQPVATNLTAYVEGGNLRLTPRELPDLYAGEPLVLLGRTRHLEGTLVVSGTINGSTWTQRIDLDEATRSPSVAKLWAYRRIAEVEAERWSGEMSYELADMAIEELGMDFHLVTTRTSLIAVDETPTRPVGAGLRREELPLILPAGWDFDTLFPARSLSSGRSDPMSDAEHKQRLELPNTSTGYFATLQLGLALFLTGLMGLAWWRRERLLPEAFARRLQREAI